MGLTSVLVTVAGWLGIVSGVGVTLLGLLLFFAIFFARGVPVGGAGLFAILTMVAGPLLTLSGAVIALSGIKLMAGHGWARIVLEVFSWIVVAASIGWLMYLASQERDIQSYQAVQGALFLLCTAVPAVVMIALLHTEAIRRAMTK